MNSWLFIYRGDIMKRIFIAIFTFISLFLVLFQMNQDYVPIANHPLILQAEIKGEVQHPGVYEISEKETLEDLIEKAGGCLKEADCSSLSMLSRITHQQVVVIPKIKQQSKISLNNATLEELMTLKNIGESRALQIIEYRKQHSFKKIEEIMEIKGIGPKTFEKIKSQLAL